MSEGSAVVGFHYPVFLLKVAEFLCHLAMEFLGLIPYSSYKLDIKYAGKHDFKFLFAGMENCFFW